MDDILRKALGLSLVIFMVGSVLQVGLELDIRQAMQALRNRRFVMLLVTWSFAVCPAVAVLLTLLLPLARPYAVGMLFLGMVPCAPFLPLVVNKARGDLAYAAAAMLVAAAGTVVFMPLVTPVLVEGFTADAWTIARPLVFYIAAPLALGVAMRQVWRRGAERVHPVVKTVTTTDTLVMVAIVLWIYKSDMLGAVGSYAILTQVLFYALVAAGAYGLGFGLPPDQRSVLALAACTRNIGAAFAPLVQVPGTDQRAIVMVAMAVPLSVVCAIAAARFMSRRAGDRPELARS